MVGTAVTVVIIAVVLLLVMFSPVGLLFLFH